MLMSQAFLYTCKKINDIFLKFHHSLLWTPTITEIGKIVTAETITNAHIYGFGAPLI